LKLHLLEILRLSPFDVRQESCLSLNQMPGVIAGQACLLLSGLSAFGTIRRPKTLLEAAEAAEETKGKPQSTDHNQDTRSAMGVGGRLLQKISPSEPARIEMKMSGLKTQTPPSPQAES
jgi:hypothetical protein